MKKIILALALGLGSGAGAEELKDTIANKGTITVGTEGTYAPFTYHDEQGKLTGYDVEVTRAVAAKLGVKVEFLETNWDAMMAGLKGGRFQLVANQVALTTPERQAAFDKAGVYNWSGMWAVAKADNDKIKEVKDFKGLKAAQSLSSNYGEFAQQAGAELVPVDGLAQSIALIEQGRADFTLNSSLAILDYQKKHPKAPIKVVWKAPAEEMKGSGLVLVKGQEEALKKLTAALEEVRADGTLKKLGEQFFGQDVSVKE